MPFCFIPEQMSDSVDSNFEVVIAQKRQKRHVEMIKVTRTVYIYRAVKIVLIGVCMYPVRLSRQIAPDNLLF